MSLLAKIKYQFKDFHFNRRIFPISVLIRYYYESYFLKNDFINVRIKSKLYKNVDIKIRCRNGIDRNVLYYVFFQRFHITESVFLNIPNPIILDLGSNIGCSIIDFKVNYPLSKIYGYEMDKDNYNLAVENCKIFTDVNLFNNAVWVKNEKLTYNKKNHTDAYSLSSDNPEENVIVECVCITDIIKNNNLVRIDYLKMDIEGAEISIFNELDLSWLDVVYSFNIEFHKITEQVLQAYIEVLANRGFSVWKSNKHWNAIEGVRL